MKCEKNRIIFRRRKIHLVNTVLSIPMTIHVIILIVIIALTIQPLLFPQNSTAQEELSIQVWLADVDSKTGKVQVCVDIPETGASNCKKFDASAKSRESVGLPSEPIIIDAGIYKIELNNVTENSTLTGCVYVFNDESGYCGKDILSPLNETHKMMLFAKYKPVFYDEKTERLYEYGLCYLDKEGSRSCMEDEGVEYPETTK